MLQPIKNWWLDNSLLVAIGVSFVIVLLSLAPAQTIIQTDIKISDKVLHSAAYVSLMWVWLLAFRNKERIKTGLLLIVLLSFFGIILEVLQGELTDYRTPDWRDVLANIIGLTIGLLSFNTMYWLLFRDRNV